MSAKYQPEKYHTAIPYLVVEDVAAVIDFLTTAFDGEVNERLDRPDGSIMHAEVTLGDSVVMLGGASEDFNAMPGMIYLYVPDTDAAYQRALTAGATSLMEPGDQFYGDRNAGVKGPGGNVWWLATNFETVSPEELKIRAAKSMQ